MPDILYVSLSDMHLGEEDSLLTGLKPDSLHTDPTRPSPVLRQLVACLRNLVSKNENGRKPTLVLNGDILELALTKTNEAAMVFDCFMGLAMPRNKELFERIIYIPGNHDHHLWELARETQYVEYIRILKGKELPIPWHTTKMFVEKDVERVPSYLLTNLVKRSAKLRDFPIFTAYPNFALLKGGGEKCVIFHHGHFIESRYQLMSTLSNLIFPNRPKPEQIWDIEAENFAWIDFFWSTMGRSGEVGQDVEMIYEKMLDPRQFKDLLYRVAESISKKRGLPGWVGVTIAKILTWAFRGTVNKITGSERAETRDVLTQGTREGLMEYIQGPLQKQVIAELGGVPSDVTFVFGHTHKPYQRNLEGERDSNWKSVYNSGGWVVETVEREPIHGGAVVLVDENLNLTSLRMYNEAEGKHHYTVEVKEAGEKESPFHERIVDLVKKGEPFKKFSNIVAQEVEIRAQRLKRRLES